MKNTRFVGFKTGIIFVTGKKTVSKTVTGKKTIFMRKLLLNFMFFRTLNTACMLKTSDLAWVKIIFFIKCNYILRSKLQLHNLGINCIN